jgi:RHS repeat-associated protein
LWDENGNMSQHYYASTGITRYQCWDEVNRLIGVADGENISQYIYDAGGERAIKFYGQLSKVNLNKTTVIDYASMDSYRYYPNPYMVFGPSGYTKHYYIEGERVMSHFGDVYADGALISIHSEPEEGDMDEKASEIQAQLQTAFECFGLAGQYSYSMDFEWLESEPEPAIFFYHPDHLGSSGFITDASGLVDQHFEYLPFGELFIEERGNWNTPYKFSAKELDDESGYSYFGARYYDPNISIWLSVDPLSDEYPNHSPYTYALNNPIKVIDPNGMSTDWVETTADDGSKQVVWKPEVTKPSDVDPKSGDKYLGKAGYGVENDQLTWYGEDGKKTPTAMSLPEVEINGGEMSDHAKVMSNPIVQHIHQGQMDFLNHPVTKATINTLLFVATGGIEGVVSLAKGGVSAVHLIKNSQWSDWVRPGKIVVSNQLVVGPGTTGATVTRGIKGGGELAKTGESMGFHYHIHKYNILKPGMWFKQTPIIKP